MPNSDNKIKHFKHRTRNLMAKALRDPSERKGAFAISSNKNYKRKRMKLTDIDEQDTD